jgi:hypothetical protein
MCLASLLAKFSKDETLDESDWNDVVDLAFTAAKWLYENSRIEVTPETHQLHLQPKSSKKKKARRGND